MLTPEQLGPTHRFTQHVGPDVLDRNLTGGRNDLLSPRFRNPMVCWIALDQAFLAGLNVILRWNRIWRVGLLKS